MSCAAFSLTALRLGERRPSGCPTWRRRTLRSTSATRPPDPTSPPRAFALSIPAGSFLDADRMSTRLLIASTIFGRPGAQLGPGLRELVLLRHGDRAWPPEFSARSRWRRPARPCSPCGRRRPARPSSESVTPFQESAAYWAMSGLAALTASSAFISAASASFLSWPHATTSAQLTRTRAIREICLRMCFLPFLKNRNFGEPGRSPPGALRGCESSGRRGSCSGP